MRAIMRALLQAWAQGWPKLAAIQKAAQVRSPATPRAREGFGSGELPSGTLARPPSPTSPASPCVTIHAQRRPTAGSPTAALATR